MKMIFRKGSAFATNKAKAFLETLEPNDIKKITVIRHAAIGDWVVTRPFLIELKRYFPKAKITLSVLHSYMYGMPNDLVDEIHIMNKYDSNDKTKKIGLIKRIKQAKKLPPQDIIFDLADTALSFTVILFAQSKLKIGFPYRMSRRFFYDIATLRSDFVLEQESMLHTLNILGLSTTRPLDYGYAEKYVKSVTKQIIYFAGASIKTKCWEEEKFTNLINRLAIDFPEYQHIILQGINENEKFSEIYEGCKENANVSLRKSMPLEDTMQFLADSRCLVSNDTGIRNMAISVYTPTVGLFFTTCPFRYWPLDGRNECVFNANYTSPSVDSTYNSTVALLKRLY